MKNIIISVVLLIFSVFNIFFVKADNIVNNKKQEQLSYEIKEKIDNFLEKFYKKLDLKFDDEKNKEEVLLRINQRISELKIKKGYSGKKLLLINYVQKKLKEKILEYKIISFKKSKKTDNKVENKNFNIVRFCKNLAEKNELLCQLHKVGDKRWNFYSGIIIKKVGNGEKINLGDYIMYKIIETSDKKWEGKEFIFYIGENLENFSDNSVHEKLLVGFPLGTEIIYFNSLIKLEKKVTKQDLLNQYKILLEEEIKENPGKKDEIKKEFQKYIDEVKSKLDKKLIYEKPIIQIVSNNGQESGIIINDIKYGNGKEFGKNDKVYIKNGDKINEIGKIYRKIFIEDGKLTNGSKVILKQYYNGGNGGNVVEVEIVDKK